jgi:hypothetical protein
MLNDSLFVSDTIVEKDVVLADGTSHKLFFKELPAIEFRKFYLAEQSADEDVQASSMAKLVAASLVEPDGKPAITVKKALSLKGSALSAIVNAIMEVNGFGANVKKD